MRTKSREKENSIDIVRRCYIDISQLKYNTNVKYDAREILKEGDAKMYEKFKALLEEKHITAYQFCKETGISESTVSMWKTRKTSVSVKHLRKLSEYFGVGIEYFLS